MSARFTWSRRQFLAGALAVLLNPYALAGEVIVVTDAAHPVSGAVDTRVIELDLPARIERELAAHLTADVARSTAIVQQRLHAGGPALQTRMRAAYQGVADAWSLGVAKLPAVVVDRRYVVYGEPNVAKAIARIDAYRRAHP
jgi:integrating conjugative element protein (TIGR03757 family)